MGIADIVNIALAMIALALIAAPRSRGLMDGD